ncbi:MAG: hypothetical protein RMI91_00540 [Gemmatales bacterium]|nr:hypothetical protein [Gemmatales bacterium]MDW7993119.1 hypothetical protein [Gemmatales bacterium]
MYARVIVTSITLLGLAGTALGQVGVRDMRDRMLDRQRTMLRYQYNLALQAMSQMPFCPPPILGVQQIQIVYWQQLHQGGYLPPPVALSPAPVVVAPAPTLPPALTAEERRQLREAERVAFREAPGMRSLELARLVAAHNPDLARQLLAQAIQEAGENSPVGQLARLELRKLDEP